MCYSCKAKMLDIVRCSGSVFISSGFTNWEKDSSSIRADDAYLIGEIDT